jgi:hypothetical protein
VYERLPKLQTLEAEAIIFRDFVLFNVAARLKRGQQTKNVVLVKLQSFAQLSNAYLINITVELLEDIKGVRYRLNYVVRFLPANHVSSCLSLCKNQNKLEWAVPKKRFNLYRRPHLVNERQKQPLIATFTEKADPGCIKTIRHTRAMTERSGFAVLIESWWRKQQSLRSACG